MARQAAEPADATAGCVAHAATKKTRLAEAAPAGGCGVVPPGPIGIRCLACGSDDLDATEQPRGDEAVRCRRCGEWTTYGALEAAAVEAVRRELARRLGG